MKLDELPVNLSPIQYTPIYPKIIKKTVLKDLRYGFTVIFKENLTQIESRMAPNGIYSTPKLSLLKSLKITVTSLHCY